MKDRIVQYPGRYRDKITGQLLELVPEPGVITEPGTPISKATLLSDQTAALYGMGASGVPDQILQYLHEPVRQLWRYEAFMTKANGAALDTAFGKGQAEGVIRDMGKLLNLYHHTAGELPSLVPNLTSNTDQGYTVTGTITGTYSSVYGAPYTVFKDGGSGWGVKVMQGAVPPLLCLDITFPTAIKVKKLNCGISCGTGRPMFPAIAVMDEGATAFQDIGNIAPMITTEASTTNTISLEKVFAAPCALERVNFTITANTHKQVISQTNFTRIIFSGENEDLPAEIRSKNTFEEICQSTQCRADISGNSELLALVNSSPWAKSIFNFYNS